MRDLRKDAAFLVGGGLIGLAIDGGENKP